MTAEQKSHRFRETIAKAQTEFAAGRLSETESLIREAIGSSVERELGLHQSADASAEYSALLAQARRLLADVQMRRGDYEPARLLFTDALETSTSVDDSRGEALALIGLGRVHFLIADYSRTLEYCDRAFDVARRGNLADEMAMTYMGFGMVNDRLGNHALSLDYLHSALQLFEELGNSEYASVALGNVGHVYQRLGDYSQARHYYERALDICTKSANTHGMAANLGDIGTTYCLVKDYDRALEYYNQELSLFESLGNRRGMALSMQHLGEMYATPSSPRYNAHQAEEYYRKALDLNRDLGTRHNEIDNLRSLAELYEAAERWRESQFHLKQSYELERQLQNDEALKKAEQFEHRQKIAEQERQFNLERARALATEEILHKVLPTSIAARLVHGERIADFFANISILFADIVGFTPISAQMPAHIVVKFLNHVFGIFDAIMKEHGCEKIKTIGDGYMAVAGAPEPCDDHAERIARAALAMQNDILLPDDVREYINEGAVFNLRIGLHTGSAVGGIIGDERFVYDVHGDAVNIAARMESSGEPGKIHVSEEFAMHLLNRMSMHDKQQIVETQNFASLRFVARGQVEIKGKGLMRTYFLESN